MVADRNMADDVGNDEGVLGEEGEFKVRRRTLQTFTLLMYPADRPAA
jgi:hypothetical protein